MNTWTLAYALDLDGSETYTIFFKDLENGKLLEAESIEKTGHVIEWLNDNRTILYNTQDSTFRSEKIWRRTMGSKTSELVFYEQDEKFSVGIYKTLSHRFIIFQTSSSLTSECHYMDANVVDALPTVFLPREFSHKYSLDHQGQVFLIQTNGGGKYLNFRLCSCPIVITVDLGTN